MGFDTLAIRASMSEDERSLAAERFNDPMDPSQVLLSTFELVGFGMNLHGACNVLVILEEPRNTNTKLQGLGRVFRMAQKYVQYVYVVQNKGTIDGYVESNNYVKFKDLLRALGRERFTASIDNALAALRLAAAEAHPDNAEAQSGYYQSGFTAAEEEGFEAGVLELFTRMFGHPAAYDPTARENPKDIGFGDGTYPTSAIQQIAALISAREQSTLGLDEALATHQTPRKPNRQRPAKLRVKTDKLHMHCVSCTLLGLSGCHSMSFPCDPCKTRGGQFPTAGFCLFLCNRHWTILFRRLLRIARKLEPALTEKDMKGLLQARTGHMSEPIWRAVRRFVSASAECLSCFPSRLDNASNPRATPAELRWDDGEDDANDVLADGGLGLAVDSEDEGEDNADADGREADDNADDENPGLAGGRQPCFTCLLDGLQCAAAQDPVDARCNHCVSTNSSCFEPCAGALSQFRQLEELEGTVGEEPTYDVASHSGDMALFEDDHQQWLARKTKYTKSRLRVVHAHERCKQCTQFAGVPRLQSLPLTGLATAREQLTPPKHTPDASAGKQTRDLDASHARAAEPSGLQISSSLPVRDHSSSMSAVPSTVDSPAVPSSPPPASRPVRSPSRASTKPQKRKRAATQDATSSPTGSPSPTPARQRKRKAAVSQKELLDLGLPSAARLGRRTRNQQSAARASEDET